MTEIDAATLRKQTVKAIVAQLAGLTPEQLQALDAAERGDENPRESLLDAIDAESKRRAAAQPEADGAGAAESPAAPSEARDSEAPSASDEQDAEAVERGEIAAGVAALTDEQFARVRAAVAAEDARRQPSAEAEWLKPEYTGPLTADQAQQRIARYGAAGAPPKT